MMKEMMISAFNRYFAAVNSLDREAYLACFSEDAVVMDPYGGRVLEGRDGLNKFFNGMERTWNTFAMTPQEYFISGNRAAVRWNSEATAKSGKTAQFAGINVFNVNEDGLIDRMEGYWDAAAMMAQIS
jgi:steroid Delta-isomerase